jgi:3-hydroxyacyl-[acyl-carrier-protein] dehydratase
MHQSREVRFAVDHPTAAGHFPGNPIIPGAVLLDEVVEAIAATSDPADIVMIRSVKFHRPVRPGELVNIRWEVRDDGQIGFECRVLDPEQIAMAGTLHIGRADR